jgi:hypothetical protein
MTVSITFVLLTVFSAILSSSAGGSTIASSMVQMTIGLMVPACGYFGAKRRDNNLVVFATRALPSRYVP